MYSLSVEYMILFFLLLVIPFMVEFIVFVLYMLVVWNLFKSPHVRRSYSGLCNKLMLATLLLFMSGVASIACQVLDVVDNETSIISFIIEGMDLFQNLTVCSWIVAAKSNREVWCEYYRKRVRNQNSATAIQHLSC